MSEKELDETLLDATCESWNRYLSSLDDLRPALFRYCRALTGNVWDAEDLVQDALEKGFAKLAAMTHKIENPRGYVLRIASNLWLSELRHRRMANERVGERAESLAPAPAISPESGAGVRDAGAALLQLAPQERAAVLLKETFDMTLEEIAEVLATSVGAVKAALHRGRARLRDERTAAAPRRVPARAVLDRFVERYNARDLPALLDLLLDGASVEMPGVDFEVTREVMGRKHGWLYHNFVSPYDQKPVDAVWETAEFLGEPLVLVSYPRDGERVVGSLMRFETDGEQIARIRVYAFCPDTVREVGESLGKKVAVLGVYRFPGAPQARLTLRKRAEM